MLPLDWRNHKSAIHQIHQIHQSDEGWGGGGREGEEGEEIFHPNRPRKCLQSNRTVCVLRFDPVFTSLIVKSISG